MNYRSEIWGNTYAIDVECITVIQKRLVRLVCGTRRLDHTNPLFKQICIFKCIDLVTFKTSIIMFKEYRNELPDSLCSSCSYQCNIDVHLNIWREIMEFTTSDLTSCRSLQLFKNVKLHFILMY